MLAEAKYYEKGLQTSFYDGFANECRCKEYWKGDQEMPT